MYTIFNQDYNIDIFEAWDNDIKLYHIGITKFDKEENVIGVNWVYVQTNERYQMEKELKTNIKIVESLYKVPKNSRLEFIYKYEFNLLY